MSDREDIKDCKAYEWYGDKGKLRRRYGELMAKIGVGTGLTREEEEELEILVETSQRLIC